MQISGFFLYIDKNNTLHELKTEIVNNSIGWKRGSLDAPGFKASSDYPYLESGYDDLTQTNTNYTPICPNVNKAGRLMYRPDGDDTVQELFWGASTDSWHQEARFDGLKIGSDFVPMGTPLCPQSRPLPIARWLYGIGTDSQLQEWHCENCCVSTTFSWKRGNATDFPSLHDNPTLSLAGQTKRIIPLALLPVHQRHYLFYD
jgi:hypothetical protein